MGPVPADGKSAVRPLAGPVVPLTVVPGASEELLGGAGSALARGDAIATQVLVKGEPVAAPSGRADDFSWRQGGDTAAASPVAPAPAPAAGAMSAVTPAAAPAASAYTEPEVVKKKPDPKPAPPVKTAEKKRPAPRPAQVAPRPPQPVQQQRQTSGPFGFFR
jgi:outer membrane biosynthesis protein TonB